MRRSSIEKYAGTLRISSVTPRLAAFSDDQKEAVTVRKFSLNILAAKSVILGLCSFNSFVGQEQRAFFTKRWVFFEVNFHLFAIPMHVPMQAAVLSIFLVFVCPELNSGGRVGFDKSSFLGIANK